MSNEATRPMPDSGREWINAEDVQLGDVILRDGEWHVVTRVTVDPIEHPTGSWRAVAIEFEGRGAEVLSTSQRVLRVTAPTVDLPIASADGNEPSDDLLYRAWVVIANVGGGKGGWDGQCDEWRAAALRWRDDFHDALRRTNPPELRPMDQLEVLPHGGERPAAE